MDFSADGSFAECSRIAAFTYRRTKGESWLDTEPPTSETLLKDVLSESLRVTGDGTYVTVERRRPPPTALRHPLQTARANCAAHDRSEAARLAFRNKRDPRVVGIDWRTDLLPSA